MSDESHATTGSGAGSKLKEHLGRKSGLTKLLVLGALVMTIVGAVFQGIAWANKSKAPEASAPAAQNAPQSVVPPGGRSFLGSDQSSGNAQDAAATTEASAQPDPGYSWSPALTKFSFSFVAAFCIAAALRLFIKTAAFFVGLALIVVFALQYFHVVDIDWMGISRQSEGVLNWMQAQFSSFQTFVTGQLPGTAAAIGGFYLGFKR